MADLTTEAFVLNYNGEALLVECLPSIVDACQRASPPCRLTVIDNDSFDHSVEMLKRDFSSVYLRQFENRVLCSFNDAVRESDADIVLLLNNDLKVEPDFIDPLVEVFRNHEDAFLAAPKAYTFDGKQYEGSLAKINFKNGILWGNSRFPGYENKVDVPGITMLAGGFAAYRKDIFLKLGGFDDLYLPGTVEDADLCFRAWKAGYKGYYVPKSRVYHKGQVTFKKTFGSSRLSAINQRNLHLFVWKNISDPLLLLKYILWLPFRLLFFLLQGRFEFFYGFIWAWLRLPQAFRRRWGAKGMMPVRTDREIFKISEAI